MLVELDMLSPVQSNGGKCQFQELFQFVCLTGGDYKIFGFFLLHHQPHCFHVFRRPSPIPPDGDIAQSEFLCRASRYTAGSGYYFPCDEPFRSKRGFMIEEKSGTGKDSVCFTIVGHLPESCRFGHGVRTPGAERSFLICRQSFRIAKTLTRTCIIKFHRFADKAYDLKQIQGPKANTFKSLHRLFKRKAYGALPCQIVYFIRPYFSEHLQHTAEIVEGNGPNLHFLVNSQSFEFSKRGHLSIPGSSIDPITLLQQKLGKIGAILP